MPVTPLHYPVGFALSKSSRRLSLPGLIVGSFIPDLEVPIMWILFPSLPDHLVLHSLVGALTLGALAAVILTRFLYAPVISTVFGVDRERLNEACRVTPTLVFSCMLGAVFHIALDIPMHPYNPVLWPWVNPFQVVGVLVPLMGFSGANLLLSVTMVVFGITILVLYMNENLWERIWLGDS
ncbi:MAG: DUF4184 family protein [Candidatus Hermodarchaeota archaeon]